jgi:hypothetical protein
MGLQLSLKPSLKHSKAGKALVADLYGENPEPEKQPRHQSLIRDRELPQEEKT